MCTRERSKKGPASATLLKLVRLLLCCFLWDHYANGNSCSVLSVLTSSLCFWLWGQKVNRKVLCLPVSFTENSLGSLEDKSYSVLCHGYTYPHLGTKRENKALEFMLSCQWHDWCQTERVQWDIYSSDVTKKAWHCLGSLIFRLTFPPQK